jgi:hypothetical protein
MKMPEQQHQLWRQDSRLQASKTTVFGAQAISQVKIGDQAKA